MDLNLDLNLDLSLYANTNVNTNTICNSTFTFCTEKGDGVYIYIHKQHHNNLNPRITHNQ